MGEQTRHGRPGVFGCDNDEGASAGQYQGSGAAESGHGQEDCFAEPSRSNIIWTALFCIALALPIDMSVLVG